MQRIRSKEILKEQARELADANNIKDKLLSVISHDLLNPLHSIMGFSELLRTKVDVYQKEKIVERVDIIDNSIKNIYFKLENLSDWSSLTRDKLRVSPEFISPEESVKLGLSLFHFIIEIKELNIVLNLNNCPMIYTDRHMFNSIIRNLLSNAIKYTPKGGEITIGYGEKSGKVELVVKDNGIGMLQEDIDKILAVDSNFNAADIKDNQSAGLGFILINAFVKQLGGSMTIKSVPEKATEVTIRLPQAL